MLRHVDFSGRVDLKWGAYSFCTMWYLRSKCLVRFTLYIHSGFLFGMFLSCPNKWQKRGALIQLCSGGNLLSVHDNAVGSRTISRYDVEMSRKYPVKIHHLIYISFCNFLSKVPFYHVLFEAVLVIWIVRLLMSKTFRFREQEIELTEKVNLYLRVWI